MIPETKQLILEVLGRGYLMSLGTLVEHNPWASDVIYIHDEDLNIYWMSDTETRHSKAIETHPQVAGTITVSGQGQDNLGLQFSGIAQKIDGARYDLALKHFAKRKKDLPQEEDDVLKGDAWYILKPTRIELIYEKLFGFEKQVIEL